MTLRFRLTYSALLLFICIVLCTTASAQISEPAKKPTLTFHHSSLGDYLYFLFNRKEYKALPKMDSLIGIENIPQLGALIALPEIVTSAQLTDYNEIYALLEKYYKNNTATRIEKPHPKRLSYSEEYPPYDSIVALVQKGEAFYPAFLKQWKDHIEPLELQQIAAWKEQLTQRNILDTFYKITKLSYTTDKIEIAAMAYHMAGSANYSPAAIYTSLFREPNLPWVIGHEGTHLLLTGPAGANWMNTASTKALSKLAVRKGETLYEVEENACHFLQAQLSKLCGTRPANYTIHEPYEEGFRRNMLAYMETNWHRYMNSNRTFIQFMMEAAKETLLQMPDLK